MRRVAIIGAGGTGSAAARFLARAGQTVTVFEHFTLDHDRGSSFGGSRIIRRTYSDGLYTGLMEAAYALWADLERDAGESLFVRCGGLTFGRPDNPDLTRTEDALAANGVPYERLAADDVRRRWPAFQPDADQASLFQPDSGLLRASACVRAQMRLARGAGAVLREATPVETIRTAPAGRLRVAGPWGNEDYDRVIVAAGPWMARVLPQLALPLTVTRQYYAHWKPWQHPEQFEAGRFPVWIDLDTLMYGFPREESTPGVKVACHLRGEPDDPDRVRREIADSDRRPLRQYLDRRLPDLAGAPAFETTCLYTNTPDEDFILDVVPGLPGAFFCSGCSGHGFKFTILLGKILSNLVQDQAAGSDIARFRLSRFSGE